MSTGRSIHAVPSITPSPREGIENGPRLRVRTRSNRAGRGPTKARASCSPTRLASATHADRRAGCRGLWAWSRRSRLAPRSGAGAGSRDRESDVSGANLSRAARSIAYALARASPPVRDGGVIREPSFASQPARLTSPSMWNEHHSALAAWAYCGSAASARIAR